MVFRKNCISNISSRYKKFKGSGDWQFWIEICLQGEISFTEEHLNHFNQHENNTTAKMLSSGKNFAEGHDIYLFLKEKKLISFYLKHVVVNSFLRYIDDSKDSLSKERYRRIRSLWEKELFSEKISLLIESIGLKVFNLIYKK